MTKTFVTMLTGAAIVLLVATATEAQLPKRGTGSGITGYHFPPSQGVQIDKDHWIWAGIANGAYRDDTGEGLLHGASVVCTALES